MSSRKVFKWMKHVQQYWKYLELDFNVVKMGYAAVDLNLALILVTILMWSSLFDMMMTFQHQAIHWCVQDLWCLQCKEDWSRRLWQGVPHQGEELKEETCCQVPETHQQQAERNCTAKTPNNVQKNIGLDNILHILGEGRGKVSARVVWMQEDCGHHWLLWEGRTQSDGARISRGREI